MIQTRVTQTWSQTQVLLIPSYATLSKLLHFSEPLLLHLQNGDEKVLLLVCSEGQW